MRIRRLLTAVVATAAFTGLGLAGTATATNGDILTPGECTAAGGTVDWENSPLPTCRGGSLDGREID